MNGQFIIVWIDWNSTINVQVNERIKRIVLRFTATFIPLLRCVCLMMTINVIERIKWYINRFFYLKLVSIEDLRYENIENPKWCLKFNTIHKTIQPELSTIIMNRQQIKIEIISNNSIIDLNVYSIGPFMRSQKWNDITYKIASNNRFSNNAKKSVCLKKKKKNNGINWNRKL